MARWKAHVNFLLTVIELLSLSLTIHMIQGKTCQNSLLYGGGRSVKANISGGRGCPLEIFLVSRKLDTFCYLTVQTAPCYVQSFWQNTSVWQTDRWTDRQTDRIAIASTELAMPALRHAVKTRASLFNEFKSGLKTTWLNHWQYEFQGHQAAHNPLFVQNARWGWTCRMGP